MPPRLSTGSLVSLTWRDEAQAPCSSATAGERQRDHENRLPVELLEQRARDQRAERRDRAAEPRPQRDRSRARRSRPQRRDQREGRRICHARREPAEHAGREEHLDRGRESGEQARRDRQRRADDQHHLAPVAVAHRAEVEHGGGETERVADGDEVELRLPGVEGLADGRQRDVGHRQIEVGDRRDQDERGEDEPQRRGVVEAGDDAATPSMLLDGRRRTSPVGVMIYVAWGCSMRLDRWQLRSSLARRRKRRQSAGNQPADVLVVFGITGDLAKVMTFHSLYRLERRGLLDCPIVGVAVDDWTVDDLREHARECDRGLRRGDRRRGLRALRGAAVLPVAATSPTPAPSSGWRRRSATPSSPVFYLEIPPSLFGMVIKGLAEAGLTEHGARRGGEAVRPRPRLGARAQRGGPRVHRRVPALPDRPLPREDGPRRDPLPAVREHDVRADLEPQLRLLGPDHDGRELRRRGPRPLLRPGRRAARRGRQPPDAGGRRGRDGAARGRRPDDAQGRDVRGLPGDARRPTRRTTCAGSTRATATSTASPTDSTTETYAALRLEIDNWRWSGVPFFIRTGKHLPVTQTELRLVFRRPAAAGLRPARAAATGAGPARGQARPDDRASGCSSTPSAPTPASPSRSASTWSSPRRAARAPTPYEVLLHAAMIGRQHALHPPGRRRGGLAGPAAAARLAAAGPRLREGIVGPGRRGRARRRPRRAGTSPWVTVMSTERRRQAADAPRAAERRRALAVPADRRLRVPVELPHGRPRRARRRDRLAVRAALRLAERVRHAARPPGRPFRLGPFGINVPAGAHLRARHEHPRHDLEHADRLDPRARRADDGPDGSGEDEITPHTRPPADDDADHMLVRTVVCLDGRGRGRAGLRAGLRLRAHARRVDAGRTATATRPTPPAPTRRSGCRPTWRSASRATACAPGTRSSRASRLYCALSWAEELAVAAGHRRGQRADRRDGALLARAGWGARACPTTAGASRSSARR